MDSNNLLCCIFEIVVVKIFVDKLQCPVCYGFIHKRSLKRHIRFKHEEEDAERRYLEAKSLVSELITANEYK